MQPMNLASHVHLGQQKTGMLSATQSVGCCRSHDQQQQTSWLGRKQDRFQSWGHGCSGIGSPMIVDFDDIDPYEQIKTGDWVNGNTGEMEITRS
jgi:hypothetical protein